MHLSILQVVVSFFLLQLVFANGSMKVSQATLSLLGHDEIPEIALEKLIARMSQQGWQYVDESFSIRDEGDMKFMAAMFQVVRRARDMTEPDLAHEEMDSDPDLSHEQKNEMDEHQEL